MGDELCCSLCVDIFREPVYLPCHHSFCRKCLRFLVEKSKPIEGEDKPNSPGSNSIPHHVTCPLCRAPTVLTQEDITALPVNRELGEKVAKIQPDVKAKEDTPLCSMCKDATISVATIFCSNCDGFFCHDCLTLLHPMRGPFKRHTIVPVNELWAQKVTDGHGITDKTVGSNPSQHVTSTVSHSLFTV
ncbi:E3 ubiquitin-protein ligase TRIM9-like [Liolophura sinensis]|uniref:E3 ubiquitin-protein ligase TRIM9-like n=1 Tax=Liolophura sinensis TaxID=3198878 RepID=UPI0031582D3C